MRRELVQAGAWAVATGAAVSVSWLGVHSVLADDGYQQPSALPLSVTGSGSRTPAPLPTSPGATTEPPTPTPSARHSTSPSATPSSRSHASPTPSTSASASGQVKSYTPNGGRIVVAMGATSASLVSATPDSGWSMHVYTGDEWLRVDFVSSTVDSIFYVTWNGTAPMVQTWQAPAPG